MRESLIKTALGELEPDLVLKNVQIINVFSGEICFGDIAIKDGAIAAVGQYPDARKSVDLDGKYVAPGFIDAHCHVESSMVTPAIYCKEAVAWGTTTLITDPHEIANVAGAAGVQFMLDDSQNAPVNYYVQLPSCVPATPFEHAGAVFTAEKMAAFTDHPRVSGLGEMMDYPGVAGCNGEVMAKLALFDGGVVDGHAPAISGNDLQAYIAAGIRTDHESTTYEEAREKLRAGLAVLVREGSACKNLEPILSGVLADGLDTSNMAFCTDDKHLSDIRKEGTIRHAVRRAVALGLPAVKAIQMATVNAARIYRLYDIGAVAPGYRADLVVLDDLQDFGVHAVYKDGICVAGRGVKTQAAKPLLPAQSILQSVNFKEINTNSFDLPPKDVYPVINMIPGNVTTTKSEAAAKDIEGLIRDGVLRKIAVIERHHATGLIGVGFIAGYGLAHGAVATTVAHDSHNLIVVGDNDADMLKAARELSRVQGGYTIVRDGKVLDTLPLPVAGLMCTLDADELITSLDNMIDLAHQAGVSPDIDPFITLSFMALPVIPEIRITDSGVFDVTKMEFIR